MAASRKVLKAASLPAGGRERSSGPEKVGSCWFSRVATTRPNAHRSTPAPTSVAPVSSTSSGASETYGTPGELSMTLAHEARTPVVRATEEKLKIFQTPLVPWAMVSNPMLQWTRPHTSCMCARPRARSVAMLLTSGMGTLGLWRKAVASVSPIGSRTVYNDPATSCWPYKPRIAGHRPVPAEDSILQNFASRMARAQASMSRPSVCRTATGHLSAMAIAAKIGGCPWGSTSW
mmetsp:Transcript_31222/g.95484  ORF Transcript_31222/g.95484 Transcript_31222/m.95484 type:complete len:233 (-) Transcript_31222:663-1361(-)